MPVAVLTRNPVVRANSIVLAVLIAILLLVGGVTWERFTAAREARDWSRHSTLVLSTLKDLDLSIHDAEADQRGFLLTGDSVYLGPYEQALGRMVQFEGDLRRLTADNPVQQAKLNALAPVLQHKREELARTVQLKRAGDEAGALGLVRSNLGLTLMQDIEARLAAVTADETALLLSRMTEGNRRGNWVRGLTVFGTVVAVAGLLWAAWLLNGAWRRARDLEAEQRRAAVRLQTSFDNLSQGVAVFDAGQALHTWNARFGELLELAAGSLVPGRPYADIAALTARDGTALLDDDAPLRPGPRSPGEPIADERRVGTRTLELRRTAMPDGGFVVTASDLTSRVQAEEALREGQKMQAIGQLTGGIAHDFNNLLTVILGNLEALRGKLGRDHPMQSRIERGLWAAERGATLTRQLLAFARKQPLAPKPVDLCAIVPALVPLLQRTLGEAIDVRCVTASGAWLALADAAQVDSALLNLALNARDAMLEGGRLTIEIANKVLDEAYAHAHVDVRPGDYLMLAVSDTGHGMAPEILARVFEPFFTTKPDGKGTGLGLAMVFGFAKQSLGHIKIYSEPGQGTTVRLYLPRAVGASVAASPRHGTPVDLPRGTASVLVVEDEPAVREIAVSILTELGYRVLEAGDGEDALRVFGTQAGTIDLLLTDVVLPGPVRGRELAERAAAIRPGLRVLFMSGYTENSIVHGGRLDEGVHLIDKPFHREELARKVADVLGASGPLEAAEPDDVVVALRKGREG